MKYISMLIHVSIELYCLMTRVTAFRFIFDSMEHLLKKKKKMKIAIFSRECKIINVNPFVRCLAENLVF